MNEWHAIHTGDRISKERIKSDEYDQFTWHRERKWIDDIVHTGTLQEKHSLLGRIVKS